MKYRAILFDFDGVLAETMEDLFLAWKKAFSKFNLEIKEEDYYPLEGTKVIEIARIISEKYEIKINPDEVVKLKDEYYLKNNSFRFYPGVLDFIDILISNKIKIGIVSASSKNKLNSTVPENFLKKFNVIITNEDYSKGKPDPEPYLNAAKKINLKNNECIVVENAPLGINSAKNAGMFCIGITSTVEKDKLKEADLIINNFKELLDLSIIKDILSH